MDETAHRIAFSTDVANLETVFAFIDRFCADAAVSGDVISRLKVIAEEIVLNIIAHGFNGSATGRIDLALLALGDGVQLTTADSGPAFDPFVDASPPDCEAALEARPIGGLGIHLVKRMAETVGYAFTEGQNILTVLVGRSPGKTA